MPAVKRSMSSISNSDDENPIGKGSSEYTPSQEDLKPNTKKSKKSSSKSGGGSKRVRTNWSDDEDVILIDLMLQALKKDLWEVVKADERLKHRGANGINVHCASLLKKVKTGGK